MWNGKKRKRLEELREPGRQLDATEQDELAALVRELEDSEAAYLKPAAARLRRENEIVAKQNLELADLNRRRESLVRKIENTLAEALAEEHAIETQLAAVSVERPDSNLDE
jgi:hypothetical protein